jgi:hypothetical protein
MENASQLLHHPLRLLVLLHRPVSTRPRGSIHGGHVRPFQLTRKPPSAPLSAQPLL